MYKHFIHLEPLFHEFLAINVQCKSNKHIIQIPKQSVLTTRLS